MLCGADGQCCSLCKMASRVRSLLFSTFFLFYEIYSVSSLCDNVTSLSEQIDTMLAEYDRETPPDSKVIVNVSMDLRHVNVYEKDSTVQLLGDIRMEWQDKRISWNATEWNCDGPLVTAERLWLPDVTLLNAAGKSTGDVGLRARISSTGNITWVSRLDITVPISLNLENWPKDSQIAAIKFGSRAYSIDELELTIPAGKSYSAIFEASSWEIATIRHSSSIRYNGVFQSYLLSWIVTLRRRAPAHSLATAGVLFTVLILLAASGALKPVARAPTAASASFIAAMWLISALLRLPGAYAYPRVVVLMSAVCICGALTTLTAAVVLRIAYKTSQAPTWVRSSVSWISLRCSLAPDVDESSREKNGTWCLAAVILDRIFVGALWITLFILAILYVA